MVESEKAAVPQVSDDKSGEFYKLPFYLALNERFIGSLPILAGQSVLDLGCGTGTNTRLIAEKVGESGRIFAVDILERALLEAKSRLSNLKTPIKFIRGKAEELSTFLREVAGQIDAVIIGNAIHNFEDKRKAINEVRQVIKPEGMLAFNSTFFDGAIPPEEEQFYFQWIRRAMKLAVVKMRELGLDRPKSSDQKNQARQQLTQEAYENLLILDGFRVVSIRKIPVDVPLEGFEKISQDPDFLEGSLPNVPEDVATQSLTQAVREVFREMSKTCAIRNWLEVVAAKAV